MIALVLVVSCSGVSHRKETTPRATTSVASTTTSSVVVAPTLAPLEVSEGRLAGDATPWQSIRVGADGRTLEVAYDSFGDLVFQGITARVTPTTVIVTVFTAPAPGTSGMIGIPECLGPSCWVTKTLALPVPLGNRIMVDGSDTPATNQAVPYGRSTVSADGLTVDVSFPDRGCSHVSRVSSVEGAWTVVLTVSQPATVRTPGKPACPVGGDGPLMQEMHLAAPLQGRRLVDGACLRTPSDTACKP
jgi:hypothetical protein